MELREKEREREMRLQQKCETSYEISCTAVFGALDASSQNQIEALGRHGCYRVIAIGFPLAACFLLLACLTRPHVGNAARSALAGTAFASRHAQTRLEWALPPSRWARVECTGPAWSPALWPGSGIWNAAKHKLVAFVRGAALPMFPPLLHRVCCYLRAVLPHGCAS
jgi:hypothetical protein